MTWPSDIESSAAAVGVVCLSEPCSGKLMKLRQCRAR